MSSSSNQSNSNFFEFYKAMEMDKEEKKTHFKELQHLRALVSTLEAKIDSQNEEMFDMSMKNSVLEDKLKQASELEKFMSREELDAILDENEDLKKENKALKGENEGLKEALIEENHRSDIKYQKLIEEFQEKLVNEPENLNLTLGQLTIANSKEQIAMCVKRIEQFVEENDKKEEELTSKYRFQKTRNSEFINQQMKMIFDNSEMIRAQEAKKFKEENKKLKDEMEDLNKLLRCLQGI